MRSKRFWIEGWGSALIAVGAALCIRWAIVEAYVIPTGSMLPTLLVNDHIWVNKIVFGVRWPLSDKWIVRFSSPKRGDVVIFKSPTDENSHYVKRVIGLPGDRIIFEKGHLYVNEKLVDQFIPQERSRDWSWLNDVDVPGGLSNYTHWEEELESTRYSVLVKSGEREQISFGPYLVPADHLFVMGDNRDNSVDSRLWDPKAERAGGEVVVKRAQGFQGVIKIPMGTVFKTAGEGWTVQKFRTTSESELSGDTITLSVKAVEPGLNGNVDAGAITAIDTPIEGLDNAVTNPIAMSGGEDKRFIPMNLVVGRASMVWLTCEKKLPVLTFLCNPITMRWSRLFHMIH